MTPRRDEPEKSQPELRSLMAAILALLIDARERAVAFQAR